MTFLLVYVILHFYLLPNAQNQSLVPMILLFSKMTLICSPHGINGYKGLGLLRRTFSHAISRQSKKSLYISLIRSKLIYCSQLWKPHLLKDIILALENVQRRSTKFILNDFTSSYKSRLTTLRLLPLMMLYELNGILFFVTSLNSKGANFF